ncbi:MAG: hypothetical protein AAF798_10555 [Bacteroidota bacterium]
MITRPKFALLLWCVLNLFSVTLIAHPEVQVLKKSTSSPFEVKAPSIFDAFYQPDIAEITIETDLVELIDNRKRNDYQKATFTYETAQSGKQSLEMKVKPRGKFRRRVCDFPPVMLKFPKSTLASAAYNPTFNKLKLVTHCIDEKSVGTENVMKEYLTYKMYEELTAQSYRVQLVEITYIDSKKKLNKIKRYGFVIEDTDEMAARLGGTECECRNAAPATINTKSETLMAAFQYMIGNEDWSIPMLRNLKLVQPKDGSPMIPVPYDFDFSGLVDAPYAVPNTNFGLTSIKDRIYLGLEVSDDELRAVLSFLNEKRSKLENMINDFKPLKRDGRKEMLAYMDTFYANMDHITKASLNNLQEFMKNNPIQAYPKIEGDTMGK